MNPRATALPVTFDTALRASVRSAEGGIGAQRARRCGCTAAQRLVRRESRAPAFPCQKGAGRGGRPSPWEQEGLLPIPSATKKKGTPSARAA